MNLFKRLLGVFGCNKAYFDGPAYFIVEAFQLHLQPIHHCGLMATVLSKQYMLSFSRYLIPEIHVVIFYFHESKRKYDSFFGLLSRLTFHPAFLNRSCKATRIYSDTLLGRSQSMPQPFPRLACSIRYSLIRTTSSSSACSSNSCALRLASDGDK